MWVLILAAGVGSRLGNPFPKPLTKISENESILGRQMRLISSVFGVTQTLIVVGYKKELIMEEHPDVSYVYNPFFDQTNTSKSLLRGLRQTGDQAVLWMNGDVVFDRGTLEVMKNHVDSGTSFVAVDTNSVGDEEVKYRVDKTGRISALSKTVEQGLGEAIGVNFVSSADKAALIRQLELCDDSDYFERGIELALQNESVYFEAMNIGNQLCIEVDFAEDLRRAKSALKGGL